MKIAIIGSRSFKDTSLLESILEKYKDVITRVISGAATGADTMGELWAKKNSIPTTIYKPDWKTYGKSAGFIRNELIIKDCDLCIAFWDGKSRGTAHSISLCKKFKKQVHIVQYND